MEIIKANTNELCEACITGDIDDVDEILNTMEININLVHTDVDDTALILGVRNIEIPIHISNAGFYASESAMFFKMAFCHF